MCINGIGKAQSSWRCQFVTLQDTVKLTETMTIIPKSIVVFCGSDTLKETAYYFFQKKIVFTNDALANNKGKSAKVCYRIFPFDLAQTTTHLDSARLRPKVKGDEWQFKPFDPKKGNNNVLPSNKELNYSGGLTRGISVGNNQDMVVNSNFNLQMSGKLSNDVEITAAMTDNNIPIQPDGNTAQLNQFDRIFFQIKRKNTILNVGDFELTRPQSYFVNYFKRVQGIGIQHTEKIGKKGTLFTKASGAVSRGKFARQLIQGSEGNQGPYRLQGNEGERFIIVIAGTEKVYIDGILLKRGFDNDYVVDYNQGTLTFTTKRLITKDSRITAEFDYNDQSFIRSMYAVNTVYETSRVRLHFDLYGEQDGRSSGTQQSLSNADKQILAQGGDASMLLSSGIDTIKREDINNSRILYRVAKTADGKTYFISSQHPDSAFYALRFLEVAAGQGDYSLKLSAANGRVYEYVGAGRGDYIIGSRLTAPKLIQLYAFGSDFQLFKKKNATLKTEMVMSNNDLNRLSEKDNGDNLGFAAMLSYQHKIALSKKTQVQYGAFYEGTQARFKVLNPYRAVEFGRDWNTGTTPTLAAEQLLKGSISISRDSLGLVTYEYHQFQRLGQYEGKKQLLNIEAQRKSWSLSSQNSLLHSASLTERTTYFKPRFDIKKTFKKTQNNVGFYFEKEANERLVSDTLSKLSFDFQIFRLYSNIEVGKNFQLSTYAQQRQDFLPKGNSFLKSSTANELNIGGNYKFKKTFTASANIAYRKLLIDNTSLTTLKPQESYLGRINLGFTKYKGAISANSVYEIGSGQEQRIEYYYQKVQPGLGNLSWQDFNKDGNIQQDEVFPAFFRDSANIVRFVLPTNQFIRTNNLDFTQVLNLTPKYVWEQRKGIRRWISTLSTESAWQLQNKIKLGTAGAWNPFVQFEITDTALVSATNSQRHTLYYQRNHQTFEMSLGRNDNISRSLLVTGYDIRGQYEDALRLRYNFSRKWSAKVGLTQNVKKSESEYFPLRNYYILSKTIEPELNVQPNKNFRFRLLYKYVVSKDTVAAPEKATIQDFSNEIAYNYSTKTTIRTKFSFVKIAYFGEVNSPVQYVMLNALQAGNNYIWGLQLNQALNKTLQLEIRYDGRKTGTSNRIIHTGNMAMRAMF